MVGLFFTIIAVLSVVYMITRAVSCRREQYWKEQERLWEQRMKEQERLWEQRMKVQKRLEQMKKWEDYLQNIVANEELVLVNHDNISIVCDWWKSAIESGKITESNLYKRLHLHLNATGSLATKIVNGKPEPVVISDTYITNASCVWVPPLYGASSIEVYVRPGDEVVEGDTGHNKILCSGVVPSDIPYLRGDVAKIISEQSKRAKEVIERATAIEKIFDEICDFAWGHPSSPFEGADFMGGVSMEGATFYAGSNSQADACAKPTDSTPNSCGFLELVGRCRKELKDMKVPEKVLKDFDRAVVFFSDAAY